ncbi:T9SS type A sorting domain-containing protein [Crocinitomix algicola]|uniref:T9SS type A sorting domain-containing protein n=1 Tax=Crocinitomix algicola TaxID=1740263 RepID=UPI0008728A65|nr:T9SS type A sorting domain-containing protein [Crocinitomix algicola]
MLPIYRRNAGGTAEVTFRNCIFNENDNAANNFQVGWEDVDNTTDDMDVNIDHSLFQDTTGLRYTSAINLFKEDALFVNPAAMNYTLSDDSPAINVGNTEAVIDFIPLTDLSGAVRIQGGIIDLGCYESSIVDDLGKDHLAPLQISLFPNPTNGQIQLKSTEKIQYVEVLNLSGESLLKSTATTINLTSFSAGIYLIHIYTNNAVIQQKIIKE